MTSTPGRSVTAACTASQPVAATPATVIEGTDYSSADSPSLTTG